MSDAITETQQLRAQLTAAIGDRATAQARAAQALDIATHLESENARLTAMLMAIRVLSRQWTLVAAQTKRAHVIDAQWAADEITWILEGNEP